MGVNYTLDAGGMTIKLNYASHELGTAKSSQTAASVTAGDFVVTMASNETKTTAGASDRSGDVIGVTYKMTTHCQFRVTPVQLTMTQTLITRSPIQVLVPLTPLLLV